MWAKWLANKYYGQPAARNYWNGCSTGGRQGWALAEKWGSDFDGFVVGAPANFWQEFRLEDDFPAIINRDLVVGAGDTSITQGQLTAATNAAIAACDVMGTDTVADGVIDDPRACNWSAVNNICGAPGAPASPNCVDALQASVIDLMWDGPRNRFGRKLWHAVDRGVGAGGSLAVGAAAIPGVVGGSTSQVLAYNHRDMNFSVNNLYSSRALAAANPLGELKSYGL